VHVVVDASLLAGALIDTEGSIGHSYRRRLSELVGDDRAYVMRTLTKLEVVAALRNQLRQVDSGRTDLTPIRAHDCEHVMRNMPAWPFTQLELTQPMIVRVWELRNNVTPYDAMYVAATEQLFADHAGDAVLATADARLAAAPNISVPMELFRPDA
jgi:predicted nucleic acid-binding protein